MIIHGRDELESLALALSKRSDGMIAGWTVESWGVDTTIRTLAIACYAAVLEGGTGEASSLLAALGI